MLCGKEGVKKQSLKKTGSTVSNGNLFSNTKACIKLVEMTRRSRRRCPEPAEGKKHKESNLLFPFVYFVSFVVRRFPVNYGRPRKLKQATRLERGGFFVPRQRMILYAPIHDAWHYLCPCNGGIIMLEAILPKRIRLLG